MKKIFASLIATVMLAAGVAFVGASSATAAPYPGTVPTRTKVFVPDGVKRHHRATVCAKVTTQGNADPKGHLTITVKRDNGGYYFRDTSFYKGGLTCVTTGKLNKPGRYIAKAKFDAKPGSVFQDSSDSDTFRVSRR